MWQFGSYNGYWPEAWSCCERAWNEPGCTRGRHNGVRVDKRQHLCLQHGEPNPLNNHPDSACGKYFTIKEDDGCKYHPGYTKDGSWTCCGADKQIKDGCNEGKHVTIPWPDEKAKLNFYPKSYNNPGLKYSQNKSSITKVDLATLILTCDYFKEIKPYDNPITKLELLKMKREKEKDEPRYCLRWACEKIYKDTENIDASCVCHPGKWDHGSTGTKMTQFVMEMKSDPKSLEKQTILWKPHWTCCRSDWNSPGCRRMTHRGPLLEELEKYGKKYKWPDARLKLSFNKVVSEKWKEFIKQYSYPPEKVQAICKKFFSEGRVSLLI